MARPKQLDNPNCPVCKAKYGGRSGPKIISVIPKDIGIYLTSLCCNLCGATWDSNQKAQGKIIGVLTTKGRIVEHRFLWSFLKNSDVPKGHVIHHINGIRSDNRIENLVCLDYSSHIKAHRKKNHESKDEIIKDLRVYIEKLEATIEEYKIHGGHTWR